MAAIVFRANELRVKTTGYANYMQVMWCLSSSYDLTAIYRQY